MKKNNGEKNRNLRKKQKNEKNENNEIYEEIKNEQKNGEFSVLVDRSVRARTGTLHVIEIVDRKSKNNVLICFCFCS